ncbi:hypothetical protein [Rubellimicrobium aerolatum]|uniref:Uncharacterized protein n=2 Tax=Rubellimicrobium aerolatum TaxID=490979 RepID=A0ABW0SEN9_9RHOB|nr:hypothetical protein [Rubellimicrobium aerolatum]MBP1806913.1 hypothetical protein [Rubellimicrobium aerolatum]
MAFFGELAEKRSTYLFLPVVACIDRHRGDRGPLRCPPGALQVDGLAERHVKRAHGQVIRSLFDGASGLGRERDLVLLALMVALWDEGPWQGEQAALLALVRGGLLRLLADPAVALQGVRIDRHSISPHAALATEILTAAEEIATRAPWLWLEALFVVENALTGPQWFDTASEVMILPTDHLS